MAKNMKAILSGAKKLIDMDNRGEIDVIAENAIQSGSLGMEKEDGSKFIPTQRKVKQAPPQPVQQINESFTQTPQRQPTMPQSIPNGMPREIFESFSKNPPMTNDGAVSVLDMYHITDDTVKGSTSAPVQPQYAQQIAPRKQVVTETVQQNTGGIDYSLIKMIVEESVKKYMGALHKKLIKENTQPQGFDSVNLINLGKKFQFVTENGDLYEAELVYKKNLKEGRTKKG